MNHISFGFDVFPQLGLPKGVLTVDKVLDACGADFRGSVPGGTGDFENFAKRLLHMRKSRKSGSSPAMSKGSPSSKSMDR